MIRRFLDRPETKLSSLRRLARYLGVRGWSRLRRERLIEEIRWQIQARLIERYVGRFRQ